MKEKEIFIFTVEDDSNDFTEDFFDNYMNTNFEGYTFIMSENNQSILINEEENAFMVMEYV